MHRFLHFSCNWDTTNEALKPDNVESCKRASGQTDASGYGDGSIAALDRTDVVSRWSWWTTFRVQTTTLEPHTLAVQFPIASGVARADRPRRDQPRRRRQRAHVQRRGRPDARGSGVALRLQCRLRVVPPSPPTPPLPPPPSPPPNHPAWCPELLEIATAAERSYVKELKPTSSNDFCCRWAILLCAIRPTASKCSGRRCSSCSFARTLAATMTTARSGKSFTVPRRRRRRRRRLHLRCRLRHRQRRRHRRRRRRHHQRLRRHFRRRHLRPRCLP